MIQRFTIERINKTPAVFDLQKLLWMNGQYLMRKSVDQLLPYIRQWLEENNYPVQATEEPRFRYLINLYQIRAKTLKELAENLRLYFDDPQSYDEKGVRKHFAKENAQEILQELIHLFKNQSDDFFNDLERIEQAIRGLAEAMELSAGKVIHPLRLALTGQTASPGIFELIYVLGRKKVLNRLKNALNYLKKMNF